MLTARGDSVHRAVLPSSFNILVFCSFTNTVLSSFSDLNIAFLLSSFLSFPVSQDGSTDPVAGERHVRNCPQFDTFVHTATHLSTLPHICPHYHTFVNTTTHLSTLPHICQHNIYFSINFFY